MKQLLNISKERKVKEKSKQPIQLHEPEDQEQNFIFNTNSESEAGQDPPEEEIVAYAQCIGIKLPDESDLLYIARQGLLAQLPDGWKVQEMASGQIMYVNKRTKQKSLDHPCDEYFRQKVITERKRKIKNIKGLTKIDIPKSKTSFVANIFRKDEEQPQISPGSMFQKTEGINSNPVLYDEQEREPQKLKKQQRQRKKRSNRTNDSKQRVQKQQSRIPTPPIGKKKQNFSPLIVASLKNERLIEEKKKKIEESLRKKYQYKLSVLQQENLQKMEELYNKEVWIRNLSTERVIQEYPQLVSKAKKQVEREMMQIHLSNLKKIRHKEEENNKKQLLAIYSAVDAENLFTEMAQMRKLIGQQSKIQNPPSFLEQLSHNSKFLNEIEVERISLQSKNKLRKQIYQLLMKIDKTQHPQKIYSQIQTLRESFIAKIDQQLMLRDRDDRNERVGSDRKKQLSERQRMNSFQQKLQKEEKEQGSLYLELETLRDKLMNLKDENQSHQGDLTDRQNKLFQILQNRASLSSRSNPDS